MVILKGSIYKEIIGEIIRWNESLVSFGVLALY